MNRFRRSHSDIVHRTERACPLLVRYILGTAISPFSPSFPLRPPPCPFCLLGPSFLCDTSGFMTHLSPAVYVFWSCLSTCVRLLGHNALSRHFALMPVCSSWLSFLSIIYTNSIIFDRFGELSTIHVSHYSAIPVYTVSIRWGQQTRSGAFKRVMTFTYLVSVPLIVAYSVGMTVVKYREGYSEVFGFGSELKSLYANRQSFTTPTTGLLSYSHPYPLSAVVAGRLGPYYPFGDDILSSMES